MCKHFWFWLLTCIFFFLLGILSSVWKYQADFERLQAVCVPYDCTTDTECEEQEQSRREVVKKLNIRTTFHL